MIDTFTAAFEAETKRVVQATNDGIKLEAAGIVEDAQALAPVITGELRDSGHVRETGDEAAAVFDADHALRVHENPDGDGFRFLERAGDARMSSIPDNVADHVKRGH